MYVRKHKHESSALPLDDIVPDPDNLMFNRRVAAASMVLWGQMFRRQRKPVALCDPHRTG